MADLMTSSSGHLNKTGCQSHRTGFTVAISITISASNMNS